MEWSWWWKNIHRHDFLFSPALILSLVLHQRSNLFQKVDYTRFPPENKPVMIWDGTCGFCKYWITYWHRLTQDKIDYESFQTAAERFKDIDLVHFKQASRLIETDGKVYSGPRSAYRTFTYGSKFAFLDRWYQNYRLFEKISDRIYQLVASNRNFFFRLTKAMFGSNPNELRPFWFVYLCVIVYLIYIYL